MKWNSLRFMGVIPWSCPPPATMLGRRLLTKGYLLLGWQ